MNRSLDAIRVFEALSPPERQHVERVCTWRTFDAGETLVAHGDTSRDIFFLVEGRARSIVYAATGTVVAFGDLRKGGMFGEIAAIDGKPRSVSVEALEPCVVASLGPAGFRDLVRTMPDFAFGMLDQICINVRMLQSRIYEFSTLAVNNRIHAEFLRLALSEGVRTGNTVTLTPAPPHADLAAHISTHREAVTREINRLVKLGVLQKVPGGLMIADFARLEQMVRDASGDDGSE